jgi:hypothetical protein
MWLPRGAWRREHVWGLVAAVALCWPGRLSGPFDGFPLDQPLEAIGIGVVFPALWWFAPRFLRFRVVQLAILLLLAIKVGTAVGVAQDGWCVAFDTAKPIVKDATGRPHSWDVRTDWTSRDPRCSAIMTRAYAHPRDIPAFFINLSPPNDHMPAPQDRPPLMVFDMHVHGFLQPEEPGEFSILTAPGMTTAVRIDGVEVARGAALSVSAPLTVGLHHIEIDTQLTGNRWRLEPAFNAIAFGGSGFPMTTVTPPSALDRGLRPLAGAASTLAAATLLLSALAAFLVGIRDRIVIAIAVAASVVVAMAGSQPLTPITIWAIPGLAFVALLDVPTRLRNIRGLFLLVGVPWLTFVVAAHANDIGRFSLLDAGNDWWTFQRFAYRIYLQGYWLEGGQATFWFQPLYRWIAGALHMAFGDSHFGEFMWDGACVLASAMLAYYVARLTVGFRAGVLAAVLTLTMVMRGPGWLFVGRGLSEWTAAGLLCLAAQFALRDRLTRLSLRSGILGTLGTFTRLNHLPMTLGLMAFALRCRLPVRDLVNRTRVSRSLGIGVLAGIPLALGAGLLLFAWRTWYYTGVFSVTHGTSFGMLALSQQNLSFGELLARMGDSLMMLLTMSDPPVFNYTALPLMLAAIVSVAALAGAPWLRDLPAPAVLFFLSGCVGSLVARGTAYPGRFSLHLIGIASALTVCTVWLMAERVRRRRAQRPSASR